MAETNKLTDQTTVAGQLIIAIQEQDIEQVQLLSSLLVSEDISEVLESLPPKDRNFLWDLLDQDQDMQGEILAHTNDEVRAGLLEQLDHHQIRGITENLETDDITDIARSLSDSDQQSLLGSLTEEDRTAVEAALAFPEDTAGGMMNMDFIAVRADVSLDVVLRYLRKIGQLPSATVDLFVRDREENYVGTLSINSLLTNDPDCLVAEFVETQQPFIHPLTQDREVADIFEKHDLISAAVINDDCKILGRVTIDDVVDLIREESEHVQMASAGLNEEEDIFAPALRSAKRRTIWLGINVITASFAAMVIGMFDASIEQVVALAILMPMIASMGGSAGTQTAIIVIRALGTGKLVSQNSRSLLLKETSVGLINGIIWATITGSAVFLWFQDVQLSLIFATALLINLIVAAIAGASIPLILNRVGIDPALASGLLLTMVTDSLGFFVFLGLATIVLF